MRSIGIRELRQQASVYLRDVERGETIEVTDRGRPVALLVPVPNAGTAERLIAEGRMTRGHGDPLAVTPLEPLPGVPLPSEVLARMRLLTYDRRMAAAGAALGMTVAAPS